MRFGCFFLGADNAAYFRIGRRQHNAVNPGLIGDILRAGGNDAARAEMLHLHDVARLDVLLRELHAAESVQRVLVIAELVKLRLNAVERGFDPLVHGIQRERFAVETLHRRSLLDLLLEALVAFHVLFQLAQGRFAFGNAPTDEALVLQALLRGGIVGDGGAFAVIGRLVELLEA